MPYVAYNPNPDGSEPVGMSARSMRRDLTTDSGARRWMRNLIFFQDGVTQCWYIPESRWYDSGYQGVRIA